MQVKGHAAPETVAAAERARLLIAEAEALGEPLEDPLLLFSVLYGFWVAAHAAFKGDVMRELAAQFLTLAKKDGATVPLMVGHRLMGSSLTLTGDIQNGRAHYDQAVALYDTDAHSSLVTRFGQDVGVANLSYRSLALWLLGYPMAAQTDNSNAVQHAREIGHPASLILGLTYTSITQVFLTGDYANASLSLDELVALADKTGALFWKGIGVLLRSYLIALTGDASHGLPLIKANVATLQAAGVKMFMPLLLDYAARAYSDAEQFEAARHSIEQAMTALQATGERWIEAELDRVAGEIALKSPERDAAKAKDHFERALAVARTQQAKSLELRAAMSLARLWRSQGKVQQACELLAPVYEWFTEGFDTLDLKEAKALLDALSPSPEAVVASKTAT